jgi:hypothetical protein
MFLTKGLKVLLSHSQNGCPVFVTKSAKYKDGSLYFKYALSHDKFCQLFTDETMYMSSVEQIITGITYTYKDKIMENFP